MAMRAEPASAVTTIGFYSNGLDGAGNSASNALATRATIGDNVTLYADYPFANRSPFHASC
jgi:hypothetical protein